MKLQIRIGIESLTSQDIDRSDFLFTGAANALPGDTLNDYESAFACTSELQHPPILKFDKDVDIMESDQVVPKPCYKCKTAVPSFFVRQSLICRDCLTSIIIHRVKVCLRNDIGLERGEVVLACVSGGPNSMTMANILKDAVTEDLSKR
jgi:hypothetical protein